MIGAETVNVVFVLTAFVQRRSRYTFVHFPGLTDRFFYWTTIFELIPLLMLVCSDLKDYAQVSFLFVGSDDMQIPLDFFLSICRFLLQRQVKCNARFTFYI